MVLNRRMPNGTYGGVRGERKSPLLDWKTMNESSKLDNDKLLDDLLKSKEFKRYLQENTDGIKKGTRLLTLVIKVLGKDHMKTHGSMRNFNHSLNNARKEAVINKMQVAYG